MTLSDKQEDAIWQIKTIEGQLGVRWFVQEELKDITLHTMKALVEKGHLERLSLGSHIYYRYRGDVGFEVSPRCNTCNKILIGTDAGLFLATGLKTRVPVCRKCFPDNDIIKVEDMRPGKKYVSHKFVGNETGVVIEEVCDHVVQTGDSVTK